MGILQKITSAVRLKNASPDWGTLERYIAWAFGGGASASGIVVNPQTAMQASTVYACIQVLAQSIAMLPCTLYQQATDGSKKTAMNHDLYRILREQPNDWQTSIEFFEMLVASLCLRGNAYAYVNRTKSGRVVEVLPLHPDMVRVSMGQGFRLEYQVTLPDGSFKSLVPGELFHVRGLTLNGWLGVSPIAYARESIGLALATEKFGGQLFRNGAKMGGVLEHPGKLSEESYNRLKAICRDLLTPQERKEYSVKFNVGSLLRGDAKARSEYYHAGILDGWMTRNEARSAESELGNVLNPIEGLDIPLMPLNMTDGTDDPDRLLDATTGADPVKDLANADPSSSDGKESE